MKGNSVFFTVIAAVLLLMVALQLYMPQPYVWSETHAADDTEPYGCEVFDRLMSSSMKNGYATSGQTLQQLADSSCNVLIATDHLTLNEADAKALKKILRKGATVMIAATSTTNTATDSIIATDYGVAFCDNWNGDIGNMIRQMNDPDYSPYDTIYYQPRYAEDYKPARQYKFMTNAFIVADYEENNTCADLAYIYSDYYPVCQQTEYFKSYKRRLREIERTKDKAEKRRLKEQFDADYNDYYTSEKKDICLPLAVAEEAEGGTIIFVASPLHFTNYGILSRMNTEVTASLMRRLDSRRTLRSTRQQQDMEPAFASDNLTPIDYVLSQPPLRDAWRLALIIILLFMIFHARRRQRVIPIYKAPRNHSLEFIKLIGSLYWQEHDNNDLVRKKYTLFAESLRRRLDIDITIIADDEDNSRILAASLGISQEEALKRIRYLRSLTIIERPISDSEMKYAIKLMTPNTYPDPPKGRGKEE